MTSLTHSAARPQRAIAFATIAGLHAVVVVLLVTGFARTTVQRLINSTDVIFIDEEHPRTPPPPLPPADPQYQRPIIDLGPPPIGPIDVPDDGGGTALTGPVTEAPPLAPPVTQPVTLPIRIVGKHRLPNTDEYYPPDSIRKELEGTSTVGVCVDANGRRSGEPTVVQSSGIPALDAGATHVLRDGHYARAMQGDQYVPNCYQFRIVFKLKTR